MKSFLAVFAISVLLLFADSPARAEGCRAGDGQPGFSGRFSLSAELDALQLLAAIDQQTVRAIDEDGRARLRELRNAGYDCQLKVTSTYLCRKRLRDAALPADVADRMMDRYGEAWLEFGEPTGVAVLTSDSPRLREWHIPQSSRWDGREYASLNYLEIDGGQVSRLRLMESGQSGAEFLVKACDELVHVATEQAGTVRYWIEARFVQK